MKQTPAISILMPTYNRVELLRRAIDSIFTQTFQDWELVIINDASTDGVDGASGTKAFLDELAKKDHRVRPVHHTKNYYPDISRTLNEGLELARGKYIARLDDDDYWCDPDKLKKQAAFLDTHPACVITGGGTIVIDEHDHERFRYQKLETDEAIRSRALFANPFTHSTVMFRHEAALSAGGYGSFNNAEDWDLWLRMGTQGTFYNFQDYFVRYLLTEQSKTFIFKRSQSREILRIIVSHRKEYPNFPIAWCVNAAQYLYSLLPRAMQNQLYGTLSRMKRTLS